MLTPTPITMHRCHIPINKPLRLTVWDDKAHVIRESGLYTLVHVYLKYALLTDRYGNVTHLRPMHGGAVPSDLIAILNDLERR